MCYTAYVATTAEIAWLAALIDGEGSIMLTKHKHAPSTIKRRPYLVNYPRIRPSLAIYNTDYRLMMALIERTGIERVYTHTRPAKENHKKTSYSWRMVANDMREWLPDLLPWLVCKQEQAILMIEALELKTGLTPLKGQKWRRDATMMPRLLEIQQEISDLNRRGREYNVHSQENTQIGNAAKSVVNSLS